MKILGIVGSRRRLGNTEILVKEALKSASEAGASVDLLRLADLQIQECNGCMACVLRQESCRLKDDLYFFIDLLKNSDGIVAGAPSYGGTVPGIFITLQHRLSFMKMEQINSPKMAVSIGVAGGTHIAWWVVPMLNRFISSCGFQVLESFVAGSQGPGEVLLPERKTIVEEVRRLGKDIVYATANKPELLSDGVGKLRGWNWRAHGLGKEELFTVENCCPVCFGEAFTAQHGASATTNPTEIECAFCHQSTGQLVEEHGRLVLRLKKKDRATVKKDREEHMSNWVGASGALFRNRMEEILALRSPYKEMYPFIKPPETESTKKT